MERTHRETSMGVFVRSLGVALLCLVLLGAGMTAEAVRIAAIADYGDGGPDTPRVADLVRSWGPDVIITAGDNCYAPGDHLSNVDPYYGDFVAAGLLFPAIGNHDRDDCGGYDAYFAYFGVPDRYYEVDLGPVHVFVLNSELDEPDGVTSDSVQAQWLQDALAESTAPWKLVVAHRPPYSSGIDHPSHEYIQWPFQAWGATHVLSGDQHSFEALEVDGLPYFVNGLGGAVIHEMGDPIPGSLFQYSADHGAMLIEAEASFITFTFHSVSDGPLYSVTFPHEPGEVALTVDQTTVISGSSILATWSGIADPRPRDWLGLYTPGSPNLDYLEWVYVSCTQAPDRALAAGSCAFPIAPSFPPGTYELRLLADDGFTALASSAPFMVTTGGGAVALRVDATTVMAGGSLTATWSGIAMPTSLDWLGLYTPGSTNAEYLDWIYVSCTQSAGAARAAGSCAFPILATLAPGTYHLRLLANNGFTALATSSAFTVTAPVGGAVSGPMVTTAP